MMNLSIEAYHDVRVGVDLDILGITALADDRDEIVEVNVWVIFLEQSLLPSQIDAIWLI